MVQTSFSTLTLNKITTGYDAVASNETVNALETRNYYGWNSLTGYNLVLNGNSNLTARNEININSEFHAQASLGANNFNNETHIFISDGYTDCDDFTGFARLANPSASNTENEANPSKEIEVKFIDSKFLTAHIYPNPSNGIFTISIQNPEKDLVSINLKNLLGEALWSTQTINTDIFANFDFLPRGIYLMQIKNNQESITKKLIIN
ncbi:MAG: T9SS type A sorting domain-containing protein [Nitrosopumilus sp.]|nr:T9SS type A sorting domain-containing protein [Nitrosopumilus sp.]